MRVLLVEDDIVLSDVLMRALNQGGYAVDWVSNGADADHALSCQGYDLLLLDLSLPKLDGLQVLRRLRSRKSTTPVLILTARDSLEDRVVGLDLGADDYLTKPFDLPELEARIRALIRRQRGIASTEISYGSLRFDTVGKRVFVDGSPLELSARELSALELLLLHLGRVVSKEHLTERLYAWGDEVTYNAIEVCIHRLRKRLEPAGINIRTIRGLGYLLGEAND